MIEPINIDALDVRPPELGRLRMGEKNERGLPQRRSTWRVTSNDRTSLLEIGGIYGGAVRPWQGAPEEGQWEVLTESAAIDVLIPADPITAYFERWGGARCQRRCNAETAEIRTQGKKKGDEDVVTEEPCWCLAKGLVPGKDEQKGGCGLVVRLLVVIPGVSGLGVWRLDTGSEIGFGEMVAQVRQIRRAGLSMFDVPAQLVIRQESRPGKDYVVPELRVRRSLDALVAAARAGIDPATGELGLGRADPEAPRQIGGRPSTIADKAPHIQQAIYACGKAGLSDDERHALVVAVSGGATASTRQLNLDQAARLIAAIEDGSWRALIRADFDDVPDERLMATGDQLARLRKLASPLPKAAMDAYNTWRERQKPPVPKVGSKPPMTPAQAEAAIAELERLTALDAGSVDQPTLDGAA